MKQIKTIMERNPSTFDAAVNVAMKVGWRLKRQITSGDLAGPIFIAQLEKETGTCDDCRFNGRLPTEEPCISCDEYAKWETKERSNDG